MTKRQRYFLEIALFLASLICLVLLNPSAERSAECRLTGIEKTERSEVMFLKYIVVLYQSIDKNGVGRSMDGYWASRSKLSIKTNWFPLSHDSSTHETIGITNLLGQHLNSFRIIAECRITFCTTGDMISWTMTNILNLSNDTQCVVWHGLENNRGDSRKFPAAQ